MPVLPIRDQVIYPHMMMPLFVGREKSVRALEDALEHGHYILLVTQKSVDIDDPQPGDLYTVGTVGESMQTLRLPDETVRVVIEGIARVRIVEFVETEPFFKAKVEVLGEPARTGVEIEALMRNVVAQFERCINLGKNIPPEALENARGIDEPGHLTDLIAGFLDIKVSLKQQILEVVDPLKRLERISEHLNHEIEILEIEKKIHSRVKKELEDTQKEFYLRERMKAIQQELGERDDRTMELDELRKQIEAAGMPKEVEEKAYKELDRLEKMPPASPEVVVVRTYLDWLVTLPWSTRSEDKLDIGDAEKVMHEDHYGLKKVKERILEYLAVRKLNPESKGPILCFMGPPGVGKTSMGKSIARATGRNFVRISLGGVRDEGEIRGHRRTYVGALPGRIIQGMKTVGSRNPVFMMDEIDKIGIDFRGDPAAALLEVLDPEQNNAFSDHYLEVPFDLSEVMFITTGNLPDPVPPALRDRMEIIEFPGYTEEEKLKIAQLFLVPKQLKEHGLTEEQARFTEKGLRTIIRNYTREAGVRNLEREVANVCRKVTKSVAQGKAVSATIGTKALHKYLGAIRFRHGMAEREDEVAVATGLFWTEVGGDIFSIEVTLMKGRGNLILTGKLGEVMQESAKAAFSYARSRAQAYDIDEDFYRRLDVHIHVPAAAIPKDGPSAGITLATALISALTKRPVRRDVAMTGEITLRGRVLPVGGVKEKVLAAHRAGMTTVVLPRDNEKDLEEIPAHVKRDLDFKSVEQMDEVLAIALLPKPEEAPAAKRAGKADRPAQQPSVSRVM
ncbi:MAG: endopeptidase La [Armatimonadota bacterium]|nr:MAG: endopeptidase La [Armatimonadota bacterium]